MEFICNLEFGAWNLNRDLEFQTMFKIKKNALNKNLINHTGSGLLLFIMVFGTIATMIITVGVAGYGLSEYRASTRKHDRDMAFHIAEAGVNYYRWHMAHSPTDYHDGQGESVSGPFQHEYLDKDGNLLGYYSLEIDEPISGSSIVTIRSTGWTVWRPEVRRTIQIKLGYASLTNYTFLFNADMAFGFNAIVHGTIHSNGYIRFDGTTDSWVRSAKFHGITGGGGPKSFWQEEVPEIDFFSVSGDLDAISDLADLDNTHYTSSGQKGWHFVFNNDQYTVYKVTDLNCYYGEGQWRGGKKNRYWDGTTYCYDIKTETSIGTYDLPTHGAIFVEDNVWVDGVIDGRVSIGVGKFPDQEPYYYAVINDNITYLAQSSDDVFGILAQGNIMIPHDVPDTMIIDGALLSQWKKVYRPYYNEDIKTSLTIVGSQISYGGGGFRYVNGWGNTTSGFDSTNYFYDGNLKYYPPPGFPVGNTYELLSWEETQ